MSNFVKALLLVLSLITFAFLGSGAFAQGEPYEDVEEATLAPDNPFYFLRSWQEGFEKLIANFQGPEAQADLELKFAQRRAAEIKRLARLGEDGERIDQLRKRWEQHLDRAQERAEKIRERKEEMRTKILEKMDRHRAVFEKIREQVSEKAKDAIDGAIQNYENRRSDLLKKFPEDQIEEIEEKLRKKLDSTVERFELRRERFQKILENRSDENTTEKSR
uniref:DUF5667 domain-containing protein n=1 Tax=candidate division WWE3 bacterium TaxID=2053526 RepID=A0A831YSP3_UNCKA